MSHFITYLALGDVAAVDAETLADRYRTLYGDEAYSIQAAPRNGPDVAGDALVVTMDQMPVTVMFVDKPLPADSYQEAIVLDLIWPEAGEIMRGHGAHAIVALLNDPQDHLDNLNGAAAVTLVAGALASLLPTVALVSTEGRVIMKPDMFGPLATALARHEVPVPFWTSLAFVKGEQQTAGQELVGAVTYGLLPFVGRELEFLPAPLPPADVAQRLIGLCQYLIMNGPVIKDNDTVGLTPDEKIATRYRSEGRRQGAPIIELGMSETIVRPAAQLHVAAPEPMPLRDFGGTHDAPARRSAAVFGKRGTLATAAIAAPAAAQTKGPARWPGLRLFARK